MLKFFWHSLLIFITEVLFYFLQNFEFSQGSLNPLAGCSKAAQSPQIAFLNPPENLSTIPMGF
jgi:hypothetical protein